MTQVDALVARLTEANEAYRSGAPILSDAKYDDLTEALRALAPDHPFLHTVEPEVLPVKDQVRHPSPMLSTEKAYKTEDLQRWVDRVTKAEADLGLALGREPRPLVYRVTPKLDGLAGRDQDGVLATRGNGRVGYDITRAFDRGLVPVGGRDQGVGEIVLVKSWFQANLADEFDHPRNVAVGIVKADELGDYALSALTAQVVHFVPYTTLPDWTGTGDALVRDIDAIKADLKDQVDYALDGMVAEVLGDELRAYMGATSHHHRWQIAVKDKGETGVTTVNQVVWQTGRTGNVTPVMLVEPIKLSGATIGRVTAHHAGMVRDKGIGPGARIEIIRSGEVIPKLETVLETATPELPTECPTCAAELGWRNDFLVCGNALACPAQVEAGLRHWFRTLRTADWFGPKTIARLVTGGVDTLEKVYALTEAELLALDFGAGQSANLVQALTISRTTLTEDARFLAAFGIPDLGVGDSRKLLGAHRIEALGDLTPADIVEIKGFGELTSASVASGLGGRWASITHMLELGFNLERTPLASEVVRIESPVAGKKVLFTGKMVQGTRDDMKKRAKAMGAELASSVSGKLDLLVIGEKASPKKVDKARGLGVQVLTEAEYLELLG
jgi:DNA ligase (NAD+)